jgi:hypothetical protein
MKYRPLVSEFIIGCEAERFNEIMLQEGGEIPLLFLHPEDGFRPHDAFFNIHGVEQSKNGISLSGVINDFIAVDSYSTRAFHNVTRRERNLLCASRLLTKKVWLNFEVLIPRDTQP